METLDMKCAECGGDITSISGIDETLITKALGVLQEDGVYAFYIYLCSRGSKELKITYDTFVFLRNSRVFLDEHSITNPQVFLENEELNDKERKEKKGDYVGKLLGAVRESLKNNLDHTLFAKELLERTLVYARYHAKALGGD